MKRLETAEQAIHDRFVTLEVALEDLRPGAFGILKGHAVDGNESLRARYQNRLMSAFLQISHLRDDVKRLANRRGLKKTEVDDFVKASLPVTLCVRAGDTNKHGLGGRSRNATIANGLIVVHKTSQGMKPSPDDDCIVIGMALVDGVHGVFHSHVVIDQALRHWVAFLKTRLGLDFHTWLSRCLPTPSQQAIYVPQGEHITVPLGSRLVFELPTALPLPSLRMSANDLLTRSHIVRCGKELSSLTLSSKLPNEGVQATAVPLRSTAAPDAWR